MRKVSIIIPVYNVEKYLKECIDSVIAQTYKELEIIVIDDGSTDASSQICDTYETIDSRIKVIHQCNGGLSVARNVGMSLATGDYIYFLDSDDYIDRTAVEKLCDLMEYNGADVVIFNAICFCEDHIAVKKDSYIRKGNYSSNNSMELALQEFMLDEYKPCVPLAFFNREFLKAHGMKFLEGIAGEDELFMYFIYMTACKMIYCESTFYHRRVRAGSIMTSNTKLKWKCESYYTIYQKMLEVYTYLDGFKAKVASEFIVRITKSFMLLSGSLLEDKEISNAYLNICDDIRKNHGFGDFSLIIRTYNRKLGVLFSGIRKYIRGMKWKNN